MLSFICFSQNNWEERRARKQQFMLYLSIRQDVEKVLYVEPALNFWRVILFPLSELKTRENRRRWKRAFSSKTEPLQNKLFLFTPLFFIPFARRLQPVYNLNLFISLSVIRGKIKKLDFKNTVLWLYHPFDYLLLRWFKERALSVFDWAEEWAEYFSEFSARKRKRIRRLEEKIIREVDIVFTVSKALSESAGRINRNSYNLLDGTAAELFEHVSVMPAEMARIPRPILGYAGTVFRRLDLELVRKLSVVFPDCSIVFAGNILYSENEILGLRQQKNIFFLGGKPYEELPGHIMNFDVCIMPYIKDDPAPRTKIYDYLASGKPIVATDIPELVSLSDCISFARSHQEFLSLTREALVEDYRLKMARRIELARENSWSKRAEEIIGVVTRSYNEKYPDHT